jgi:hypothetical protein
MSVSLKNRVVSSRQNALPSLLQRKCGCGQHTMSGECEGCKKKHSILQRRADATGSQPAIPPVVHEVLRSAGQPLDGKTRGFMESRFGHDFSQVRVHTDARAAQSARAVDAQAYTVGRDVVFETSQYAPRTRAGNALLAHELTHVIQQSRTFASRDQLSVAPANDRREREADAAANLANQNIERQDLNHRNIISAAPATVLQRQGKPGTSFYQDTVGTTTSPQPGITEGAVERTEIGDQGKPINHAFTTAIRFDENACKVTIPVKVAYVEPTASDFSEYIEKGQKPVALPKQKGLEVFKSYISQVNEKLNGWFGVRLQNCDGAKCASQLIPIQVEVREDENHPDYTVTAVDAKGRSYVSQRQSEDGVGHVVLIGKGGLDKPYTLAHEGAHMALAVDDEYKEGPHTERVHEDDFSLLTDQDSYRGWSQLHERHFAFVPAFLKSFVKSKAGKPCDATLQELRKPSAIDIRITLSEGYASYAGGGLYAGGGVSLGYSPGLRGTRLDVGPHFATIIPGASGNQRAAYLLGVRVGAEKRFTPSSGGFRIGGFAEGGGASFGPAGAPAKIGPYAEAGGTVGYGLQPSSGMILSIFAEAAAGTTLDPHDPDNQKWFRAGIGAGIEF